MTVDADVERYRYVGLRLQQLARSDSPEALGRILVSLEVSFQIASDVQPHAATIAVRGEVDLDNVTELRSVLDELIAATDGDIVIDLWEVSYLGSCGLHELLSARSRLAALDRRFIVHRPSPVVLRLFELCNVTEQFANADGDLEATSENAD